MPLPIGVYPFSHAGAYTGDQFNTSLGVSAARRTGYLPYDLGWPAVLASIDVLKTWLGNSGGSPVSINIGMGGTLAELVANKPDGTGKRPTDYLKRTAQAVSKAYPATITKIDIVYPWEFDGWWYSWSMIGREDAFKTCLRRIHDAFAPVDSRFRFWFCMAGRQWVTDGNGVSRSVNPMNGYPGDRYVDGFAFDVYRYPRSRPMDVEGPLDGGDDAATWAHKLNDPYGLAWGVAEADLRKKAKRINELGVAIDAPIFLDLALTWAEAHGVEVNYFDTSDGRDDFTISTGQFPQTSAVLRKHCGPPASTTIWTPVPVDVATFVDVHGVTQKVQTARKPYSMARHAASNSYRYWVKNGDIWAGDAGRTSEYNRAETESTVKLTIGTTYDYAFQARTSGPLGLATILSQLHATEDAGESASHAEYALRNEGGARSRVMTSFAAANGPGAVISEATLSDRQDWIEGHLYNFVVRIRPSGGAATGLLKVWRDGVLIVDQSNIRIGYPNLIGPYFKSGIYRMASAGAVGSNDFVLEIFNLEGPTPADLTYRILNPPPLPVA